MIAAPPDLTTEVFARVPERLRRPAPDGALLGAYDGKRLDCFLEGPCFGPDRTLYVVDALNGRILAINPQGGMEIAAEYDGLPSGLAFHRDGRLFAADFRNGIMAIDVAGGTVTPVLLEGRDGPFRGCNDLIFAKNGDLYFTDQGDTGYQDPTGLLYRLRADGRLEVVLDNVPSPNGLTLTRDENAVLLAVTRDNAVWRVPLAADGRASRVGCFVRTSGGLGGGPDGMAQDVEDGLAIAHVGLGTVWLVDRLGEPRYRVRSCAGLATTNVAYGGPDNRTLYITETASGQVLRATVPVAGLALYGQR